MSSWWLMENINVVGVCFFFRFVCSFIIAPNSHWSQFTLGMTMSTIAIYLPTGSSICHFNAPDILARSFFSHFGMNNKYKCSNVKTEAASRTSSPVLWMSTPHIKNTYTHIWLFGWLVDNNNRANIILID